MVTGAFSAMNDVFLLSSMSKHPHWSPEACPTGASGRRPRLSRLLEEWRLESTG